MQKLFSLFVFFFSCTAFSQTQINSFEDIREAQSNYFQMNRENVYLHLNKTKFVSQEGIWFTAYSYNANNFLPHSLTTNLHVKLFDNNGKEVASKVVYIYEGVGEGFFDITELGLSPGMYQLKASTNYMKNFKEDLAFYETVEILGNNAAAENPTSVKPTYDLQLLPEGGHLLANALNTIGVKLINNNGKGVVFLNANLKNSKDETISSFNSNAFGLAKFNLTPVLGENYHVEISLANGNKISSPLPTANAKGITLSVNNLHPTNVILSMQTNKETLKEIQQKTYTVLVHQNGNMNAMEFLFPENKTNVLLPIKKASLNPGINIITILNNLQQPILERLVYKEIKSKRVDAKIALKKNHIDSLEFNVSLNETVKTGSLSISVLPSATKSYSSTQNTASVFFLEPYLKGDVENASYYFNKEIPRKRYYDLDLLLLTQGWSKYEWKNIFNRPPKDFYKAEVGFSLNGKVNNFNPKKIDKVYIKSNKTGLFEILELNNKGEFRIDSLYIKKLDSLYVGSINKKTDKIKKPNLFIAVLPKTNTENLEAIKKNNPSLVKEKITSFNSYDFIGEEVLDTVLIKSRTPGQLKSGSNFFENFKVIDDKESRSFPFILDYISFNNFNVNRNSTPISITSRRSSSFRAKANTRIYLDNSELRGDFVNILTTLRTEDVESIAFNTSGLGPNSGGGVIRIKTKENYSLSKKSTYETTLEYITQDGFSDSKKFYMPKYKSYFNENFQHYGVIHWVPSLRFENQNTTSFKFLNTLTKELTFYIEGLTTDGKVISEKIKVTP